MPATYAQVFTPSEVDEHARIAAERGTRRVHAALWRSLPSGLAIFCVVADDRPGLVVLISAAFLAHQLDVCSAQIYSRHRADGSSEAVDFFWVHGSGASASSVAKRHKACARTIEEFLTGSTEPELAPRGSDRSPPAANRTEVRLERRPGDERCWILSLEVTDRPGLLHAVARTLYRQGLEIVESDVRTSAGIARDRFVIAAAGSQPLGADAADRLQRALSTAITELEAPPHRAVG